MAGAFKVPSWAIKSGSNVLVSITEEDRKNGTAIIGYLHIVKETEKALLLHGLGEGQDMWIAKSNIMAEMPGMGE